MEYELTHNICDNYVHICIKGIWPKHEAKKIIADLYNIWEKNQKDFLLIDIRKMQDKPTVITDYYNAEIFAATGFIKIYRIAVLDQPERKEANKFFETTAFNRGLRFRFFYESEQEAIDWLGG